LQTIPFGALPLPNRAIYIPLLKEHEIINAPSAASIAVLRQKPHVIGPKTLAVIADPVFRFDDVSTSARNASAHDTCLPVLANSNKSKATIVRNLPSELQRNLDALNLNKVQRLPYTRIEAEKILSLVSPEQSSAACGFAANYERVTQRVGDRLDQYRIVHFATHGFVNESSPQFSSLILSLVNTKGEPQDGLLRLYDIFNLHLAADLVVLSACETGLGKDIRGEGLVGLTRGFMYAGSRRVVASLWEVSDETTSDLMADFYQRMLQRKQTAPSALRAAQIKMWETKPDPYLWAAFTLQGEWRP
jgi:CHAT domain-containing protein